METPKGETTAEAATVPSLGASFKRLLQVIGPGIIFASLCIGETHLALLCYAGATFGFTLLWMVLLVHIVYYPVYEYGPRYAVATGESLLEGYQRTPVGRGFLWITLVFMFVTPPLILGSTGKLSSDVLHTAFQSTFPDLTTNNWSTFLFPFTLILILFGKYKRLEIFSKVMILVIVVTAVAAFATEPPPIGEWKSVV